jgi:hypothetical protein
LCAWQQYYGKNQLLCNTLLAYEKKQFGNQFGDDHDEK